MDIKNIYELEHSDTKLNNIVLYLENGLYRCYEISAYYLYFYLLDHNKKLNPIKIFNKQLNTEIINITILFKYIKEYFKESEIEIEDGKIVLNVNSVNLNISFLDWKDLYSVKKNKPTSEIVSNPIRFTTIMSKILLWQLETKSSEENYKFIRDLKNMVISMI